MLYAQIALPLPLDDYYDYIIPDDLLPQIKIGCRVEVPFGHRIITGFCVNIQDFSKVENEKLKKIEKLIDVEPVISPSMIEFTKWWAKYYQCSLGEALEATVPKCVGVEKRRKSYHVILQDVLDIYRELEELQRRAPVQADIIRLLQENQGRMPREHIKIELKLKNIAPFKSLENKGLIVIEETEEELDIFSHLPLSPSKSFSLTEAQKNAISEIKTAILQQKFQAFLLFGVTGSGKTEVYLQVIEKVLQEGKEAIVLVPEIALTPQTVIRFKERFRQVAVLHSELTNSQRSYQWQQIQQGKIQVVIGPRSAIFAPTHRLGLIVVDEEHEPSFKQQNAPRYNARDLAVKRAQENNAVIILGSATPSLESYYNCIKKKYTMLTLPDRIGEAKMPKFYVINMREEFEQQRRFAYFSQPLLQAIEKTLIAKEQAILFLNRRGFATSISCPVCGLQLKCPRCEIAMTYHISRDVAICHYCQYEIPTPNECPKCHFLGIRFLGIGTQRMEHILIQKFPKAKIKRVDSDSMTSRKSYEETFLDFANGNIDILLGTQMIGKGLDFPKVTLVGIVAADISLQLPDFRSSERAFQLIVQVAGRAGRGEKEGGVILQSYHPEHYAIQFALSQNYEKFAAEELALRQEFKYPPYGKLLRFVVEGADEKHVKQKTEEAASSIPNNEDCIVLGPAPAPMAKIKDCYRWNLLIKASNIKILSQVAHILQRFIQNSGNLHAYLDIDPISLI